MPDLSAALRRLLRRPLALWLLFVLGASLATLRSATAYNDTAHEGAPNLNASCYNCHGEAGAPGGPLAPLIGAQEAGPANGDWNATVAAADSDGDGFTNGEELQDPLGLWVRPASGSPPFAYGDASKASAPSYATDPNNHSSLPPLPPAPTISDITGVSSGQTKSGTVQLGATLGTPIGVARVDYAVLSGQQVVASSSPTTAPFSWSWNTTQVPNGVYTVRATVVDKRAASLGGARSATRSETTITVQNAAATATPTATPPLGSLPVGGATIQLPAGTAPLQIALKLAANGVYVTELGTNQVAGINGQTNAVDWTFTCPNCGPPLRGLYAIIYNPQYDWLLMSATLSQTVSHISTDGAFSSPQTHNDFPGRTPRGVGVRCVSGPTTCRTFFVDDRGATAGRLVETSFGAELGEWTVGAGASELAIDQGRARAYVTNRLGNSVTAVDLTTGVTTTIPVGLAPLGLAVNTVTNRIYVANSGSDSVSVISGATLMVIGTLPVGAAPHFVAVNEHLDHIVISNNADGSVTVLDAPTGGLVTVYVGLSEPEGVAANPLTDRIYVANRGADNVRVFQDSATPPTPTATRTATAGPSSTATRTATAGPSSTATRTTTAGPSSTAGSGVSLFVRLPLVLR